ncbi:MAG: hypothetical protein ACOY5W_17045 [Pseudomonadota bacterium]
MARYTVDLLIALDEGEQLTRAWWQERYRRAAVRAGGMPDEIPGMSQASLARVTEPESGDPMARVRLELRGVSELARARELAHMLTSVLAAEGYTLRQDGLRLEPLPEELSLPVAYFEGDSFSEARVASPQCLPCALSCGSRTGCCTQGSAFSLADVGAALLAGDEPFVARVLALPGQMDGVKWHPHLAQGRCVFHDRSRGCTLPLARMPLQCRTYLCSPERLLPPDLLAGYEQYVDRLEEAEAFIEEHMRREGGVDFGSPLEAVREAAAEAFAAWEARAAARR